MDKNITIGDAGSLLIGAGLTKLDDIMLAFALIGVGVALKVLLAYLQKSGLPIEAQFTGNPKK